MRWAAAGFVGVLVLVGAGFGVWRYGLSEDDADPSDEVCVAARDAASSALSLLAGGADREWDATHDDLEALTRAANRVDGGELQTEANTTRVAFGEVRGVPAHNDRERRETWDEFIAAFRAVDDMADCGLADQGIL